MMVPGVAGIIVGVMLPVVAAALVPHGFVAVTDTVPGPVPIVMVAEIVAPPLLLPILFRLLTRYKKQRPGRQ